MSSTTLDKPQNIGFLWSTMTKEERELLLAACQHIAGRFVQDGKGTKYPFVNSIAELPFISLRHAIDAIDFAPTRAFKDKGLRAELDATNQDKYRNLNDCWQMERRLNKGAYNAKERMRKLFEPTPFWKLKGVDPS